MYMNERNLNSFGKDNLTDCSTSVEKWPPLRWADFHDLYQLSANNNDNIMTISKR